MIRESPQSAFRRFIAPTLVAVWIVGSAPFLGRLTRLVEERLDRSLLIIVPTVLFGVAVAAFGIRVARSWRRLEWTNFAALAAGGVWAVVQATALARGRPEESSLERMHLVLYGLVALLLYRALLQNGGASLAALLQAFALTALVGLADEFVQWLVWVRVGDFYDCLLNASAAGCGVLFGVGLFGFERSAVGRREARVVAALLAGLFLSSFGLAELTNLGHLVVDPELGRFRSHYSAALLAELNEKRRVRWAVRPPPTVLQPWHIEDHFLSEAAWHVQTRNEAWIAEDWATVAAEQAILRRYYPAVLELRRPDGELRYPFWPDQVRRLELEGAVPSPDYTSPAGGNRIWLRW